MLIQILFLQSLLHLDLFTVLYNDAYSAVQFIFIYMIIFENIA